MIRASHIQSFATALLLALGALLFQPGACVGAVATHGPSIDPGQLAQVMIARLKKLESFIGNGLGSSANDRKGLKTLASDEPDPWTEIHNLQFYIWRSFAFDPVTLRSTAPPETLSISASEITEDLENRFLLIKGATWPEKIGVSTPYAEYIALCEEIIDLRKKRLYTDVKMIAKRGDLDETYRRLVDAIDQQMTSSPAHAPPSNAAAPLENGHSSYQEAKQLVQTLESEIESLREATMLKQRLTTASTEAPLTLANPSTSSKLVHSILESSKNLSAEFAKLVDSLMDLSGGKSLNSSQTIIVLVASLSTSMLILFLIGATRRPAVVTDGHPAPASMTNQESSSPAPSLVVASILPMEESSTAAQPQPHQPPKFEVLALKNAIHLLDDEQLLSDLIELLTPSDGTAGSLEGDLQWLASELDTLRNFCTETIELQDGSRLTNHLQVALAEETGRRGQAMTVILARLMEVLHTTEKSHCSEPLAA